MMSLVFLISAFMPYEMSIKDVLDPMLQVPPEIANLPLKVGFWLFGGILIAMPAVIVTRLILSRMKEKEGVTKPSSARSSDQ